MYSTGKGAKKQTLMTCERHVIVCDSTPFLAKGLTGNGFPVLFNGNAPPVLSRCTVQLILTFIQGKCCGDLKSSHEELQSSPISGVEADIGSKSIEILTDIRSRNRYLVKINLPARGHWPIRSFPPDEVFSGDLL